MLSAWDYVTWASPGAVVICVCVVATGNYAIRSSRSGIYHFAFANQNLAFLVPSVTLTFVPLAGFVLLPFPAISADHGLTVFSIIAGWWLAGLFSCLVFGPMFYYVGSSSVNQYIGKRFHTRRSRNVAACLRSLCSIFYLVLCAVLVLTISLLASAIFRPYIPNAPLWLPCLVISLLVTLLSAGGGVTSIHIFAIAASLFILASLSCCAVLRGLNGELTLTNFTNFMEHALYSQPRLSAVSFSCLGSFFLSFSLSGFYLCCDQIFLHCFGCILSFKKARASQVLGTFVWPTFLLAGGFLALLSFSNLEADCVETSKTVLQHLNVTLRNLLLPLGRYPAFQGLFLASLLCAILLTISARLVASVVIIYEDFIALCLPRDDPLAGRSSEKVLLVASATILGLALGVSTILLAETHALDYLLPILVVLFALTGPIFGLFLLAALFPCANARGTLSGLLLGTCVVVSLCAINIFLSHSCPENKWTSPCVNVSEIGNFSEPENSTAYNFLPLPAFTPTAAYPNHSTPDLATSLGLLTTAAVATTRQTSSVGILDFNITWYFAQSISLTMEISCFPFLHPVFYPILGTLVTILSGIVISMLLGGNNIYSLDWNLVVWPCSNWTERTYRSKSFRSVRRKKRRKPKSNSLNRYPTSFRTSNLPDTGYYNANVANKLQLESTL